jgi:hypothetical protein
MRLYAVSYLSPNLILFISQTHIAHTCAPSPSCTYTHTHTHTHTHSLSLSLSLSLHTSCSTHSTTDSAHQGSEVYAQYEGKQVAKLKGDLTAALVDHFAPISARIAQLNAQPDVVDQVLLDGAEYASEMAERTLDHLRDAVGLYRPVIGSTTTTSSTPS